MPSQVKRAETVPLLINAHGGVVESITIIGCGNPEIFFAKEENLGVMSHAGNLLFAEIRIHGVIVIRFNGHALDVLGMTRAEHFGDPGKGRANVNIFALQIGPKRPGVLGILFEVPVGIVPPTVPVGLVAIGSLIVKTGPGIGHHTVILISVHERHQAIGFQVGFAAHKFRLFSGAIQGRYQDRDEYRDDGNNN